MRLIDADALYDEVHGGQLSALGFDGYDDYTNINNIDDALDAIKYAPTVNQWIPCSERLPEEDGEYLTTASGKMLESKIIIVSHFYADYKRWGHTWVNVIAWMPLPSPYKEDAK